MDRISLTSLAVLFIISLVLNFFLLYDISVLREELARERRLPWKRQK